MIIIQYSLKAVLLQMWKDKKDCIKALHEVTWNLKNEHNATKG